MNNLFTFEGMQLASVKEERFTVQSFSIIILPVEFVEYHIIMCIIQVVKWRAVLIIQSVLSVLIPLQRSGANRLIGQNQYRDSSIHD